jgi:hypothetical protein
MFMDRRNEIERMPDGAARDDAMRAFRASLGSARRVTAAGDPSIELLDAAGATIERLPRAIARRVAESLCYDSKFRPRRSPAHDGPLAQW